MSTASPDENPPITHVAVRYNGRVYALPKPNRHHDVLWKVHEDVKEPLIGVFGENQGFLDANGTYLTRKQALVNARLNNQLREDRPIWNNELYSENLW